MLEVPVLTTKTPLTPEAPALAVRTLMEPLLVEVAKPLIRDILPPDEVISEVVPAWKNRSPPDPILPDPTVR